MRKTTEHYSRSRGADARQLLAAFADRKQDGHRAKASRAHL